jgi:outer membrane receptor protein involved in Fe transport
MERYSVAAVATLMPVEELSITTGGDVYWEFGESDSDLDFGGFLQPASFDLDRTVGGLFLEGLYEFDWGLSLSGSIRVDLPEGHSTEWSPRVGATFTIPETPLVIYGSWGEGFKLPSFFALGNPLVGNPNLKSEYGRGYEVGLRGSFIDDKIRSSLTYFDLDVEELIDFDQRTFSLVNRDQVVSRGVEFNLDVEPCEKLSFGGNVTYNSTDIRGTAEELRRQPRWKGNVFAFYQPFDTLSLNLRALFVGKRFDSSNPTGDGQVRLDPYQRVDISATWNFSKIASLFFVLENLLDQDYQEALGFPAPGIRPLVGIEIRVDAK